MKVVRLLALGIGRLYTHEIILVHIFLRASGDSMVIVRPEGLYKLKIPMATSGIEPTTFRLIAQYLNQLHYGVTLFFNTFKYF